MHTSSTFPPTSGDSHAATAWTLTVFCVLQSDDQGLLNTDPRTIAVPDAYINNIPTDIRGLTFSRTPQQVINIYCLGNPSGISPFFPNGFVGAINRPDGYANMATGLEDFAASPKDAYQVKCCPDVKTVLFSPGKA